MEQVFRIVLNQDDFAETIRQIIRDELKSNSMDHYLTRDEAAKLLKISLPTLGTWTKSGKIISHQVGGRVLYLKSELLNLNKIL